ncbi:serine protease (plasmid) [Ralstonia pseudosolanacearum]|uniref:S1 family peptidase n=1 Tax=Ralstonia pseudosolanacearum TaxID=1310165 RepID=UPI000AE58C0C|nr:serine protease [Ralstonia pseudosolanacearum]MDO3515269.1 serine protease [Ralstonia pseudosolanacearum]MDO3543997.1 serine protease [Ralstonia pseudosolanacearum]UZF22264.1 serine protease [Ralstonia solanacearum]
MLFKPYPGTRKALDLLTGIAPIFRIDMKSGGAKLIGTGFWVTDAGHLVTARHVVEENIGTDGIDQGPIFSIQTFTDRSTVVRKFRKSDLHPQFDLALSETVAAPPAEERPTSPITMSLDDLRVGDEVFSFAVLAHDQTFSDEKLPGVTSTRFIGEIWTDGLPASTSVTFAVRLSFGSVSEIFEKMRDCVMLPFPCIQTSVPIYGGNSGGPLFDVRGRICAVHCTSFDGSDIAFHLPVQGILQLTIRNESLSINDRDRKYRSVLELAAMQRISFDPPMLNGDRLVPSLFRWLWYAAKCLARRERPSLNIHFATVRPPLVKPDDLERDPSSNSPG